MLDGKQCIFSFEGPTASFAIQQYKVFLNRVTVFCKWPICPDKLSSARKNGFYQSVLFDLVWQAFIELACVLETGNPVHRSLSIKSFIFISLTII